MAAETSRRDVLRGGGLLIGFALPLAARKAWAYPHATQAAGPPRPTFKPAEKLPADGGFMPNAFIRIARDGAITLIIPQVEMGQGTYTAEAMLMAEELEVGLDQIRLEAAPPNDALYKEPLLQFQGTGGSTSIRGAWDPLRQAGAVARTMLVTAAAQRWNVDPSTCQARLAVVTHVPTGRTLPYAELVQAAEALPVPTQVELKKPEAFELIGKPLRRLDTPSKVNGSAIFGIDTTLPGMKFAAVAICPEFGGRLGAVDDTAARAVPGYVQTLRLPEAVAAVGTNTWAAMKALQALSIQWLPGPNAKLHSDDVFRDLDEASRKGQPILGGQVGDFQRVYDQFGRKHESVYVHPFLAHATMEPLNALVHVRPGACEIWVGTQVPTRAQRAAATVAGLQPEQVTINNQYIGGGFGRRLEADSIEVAVGLAKQVDYPLKVTWAREQDMQHDTYRPPYLHRMSARLGWDGLPVALHHRIAGGSVTARFAPQGMQKNGLDPDCVEGAIETPYHIPNTLVDYVRLDPPKGVPFSWWRGVGPTHNVFCVESFVDELAHQAGRDPVAYRRAMLKDNPRARAVLDLVASKSDWGAPLPPRCGRGVILQHVFGSHLAVVVEAEVAKDGEVRIRRATAAVDCGLQVNPNTVMAQIEGGLIFGWTAALYSDITMTNGRVDQSNFNDYRMMRINETPPILVYSIHNNEAPGGLGEAATVAAQPALCNAIFAATGVRIYRLPIDRGLLAQKWAAHEVLAVLPPAALALAAAGAEPDPDPDEVEARTAPGAEGGAS